MIETSEQLVISVGLAHKLQIACGKNGWTIFDLARLVEDSRANADCLLRLRNQASVVLADTVIDCDADIPKGSEIRQNDQLPNAIGSKGFKLNPYDIKLVREKDWRNCHEMKKALAGDKNNLVLKAEVIDFLLKHPALIPDAWKGKNILFFGTIYRDLVPFSHHQTVRCLTWNGSWYSDLYWMGCDTGSREVAAVISSAS
jgi:hypothetical protein